MKSPLPLAALAALALSACSSHQDATAVPNNQAADNGAAAAPIALPPSITASKTYRCDDSSVVYVDYFSDNTTAHLRTKPEGAITNLTAPAAGQPYTGDGYTLTAGSDVSSIKLAMPGKKEQGCKA